MIMALFWSTIFCYILGSVYEGFETINALSRSISCFYLLFIGIYYLYAVYKYEIHQNLAKSSAFWINAGLLFYFSSSFFTFLMSKKILSLEVTDFFSAGWLVHATANVMKNVVITIGFILKE